ncbi:DUF6869 domain-containing protein [Sphingopyxis terrae]|uniref:DUF6869 domain-containing protein n=1 Tax=Sphingopyxis terrae TaxID=33052 RepID=UPI003F7DC505
MAWLTPSPAELAAGWIASRKGEADDASGHLAQFLLLDFPREEPDLTWDTIILVIRRYSEADFYADTPTEAQKVCGVLAAGPVEDLLSFHGPHFIEKFEVEARRDRRMAWALGGTWRFEMTDEIWNRVQLVADHNYWKRRVSE